MYGDTTVIRQLGRALRHQAEETLCSEHPMVGGGRSPRGQIPWPRPGRSRDRQRAGFMTALGQFLLSLDKPLVLIAEYRSHMWSRCWGDTSVSGRVDGRCRSFPLTIVRRGPGFIRARPAFAGTRWSTVLWRQNDYTLRAPDWFGGDLTLRHDLVNQIRSGDGL